MKRMLLLSTVHPATDPRIVYKIAPSLAKHYQVFLALPEATSTGQVDNLRLIRLPHFRHILSRFLFSHPVVLWKCIRLRPDVVHIFVPELIPIAFVFRWLGARVVYEVQENLYKKFSLKRYNNQLLFQYFFHFFDHLARRYFHCILTDDGYQTEYKSLAHPHAIVHNYASVSFLDSLINSASPSPTVPVFFYSGVISMERAFDTLVAALAILRQTYSDFQVHLFGPIQFDWKEAQALPDFELVRPHLTFYGYTDQRVAIQYAQRATAGIALLKPVGDYPESYTTKIFEYMALKLPVVTSDFPLYKGVIETHNCGLCVSPYDAPAVANALAWLIEHTKERTLMGNRGREAVEKQYNWINEETILLGYYEDLIKIVSL
jgi:glycosyltransferase involved in cell wall biosynthesis